MLSQYRVGPNSRYRYQTTSNSHPRITVGAVSRRLSNPSYRSSIYRYACLSREHGRYLHFSDAGRTDQPNDSPANDPPFDDAFRHPLVRFRTRSLLLAHHLPTILRSLLRHVRTEQDRYRFCVENFAKGAKMKVLAGSDSLSSLSLSRARRKKASVPANDNVSPSSSSSSPSASTSSSSYDPRSTS